MAKTNAKTKKTTKQVKRTNRRGKNESLYVIIAVLAIAVIGLSVAYAALSTTLNITVNKVTQNALTWAVAFKSETVTGTMGGEQTSTTGLSCGSATSGGATVTVADTTLSKPGDRCYWKLTVQNTGGITAKLSSVKAYSPTSITCTGGSSSGTESTSMVCGNITYKLTTDAAGQTALTTNTNLAASGSQVIYLQAVYTGTTINSSAVTHNGAKFSLTYDQA